MSKSLIKINKTVWKVVNGFLIISSKMSWLIHLMTVIVPTFLFLYSITSMLNNLIEGIAHACRDHIDRKEWQVWEPKYISLLIWVWSQKKRYSIKTHKFYTKCKWHLNNRKLCNIKNVPYNVINCWIKIVYVSHWIALGSLSELPNGLIEWM